MRKLLLLLVFLFSANAVVSQEKKITVAFSDVAIGEALQKIEAVSDYRFYFDPIWFGGIPPVSGDYVSADLSKVLDDVFTNTNLNFFVQGNRIILTNNSVIYDTLPDDYFGQPKTTDEQNDRPVYYQESDEPINAEKTIALIGKEKRQSGKKDVVLSGVVRDQKTGAGIAGVLVRVSGTNIATETNEKGSYSLTLPSGRNAIEVRSLNHLGTSRKIMAYSDGKLDFRIKENPNMLEEVIVKSNAEATVKTAATGVTKIDVESIKNIPLVLGERDIFKVATTLPGIKTTGEGSAGYNVRGGKEDQNLILLDDAVLYNASHFLGFFSAVNPFTTGSATIYKGSIPAEFGGRLSSVFDITTKKANTEKITGEGGIGPVTSNLAVHIPVVKGKSGLLVGGRATYSGWILRMLKDEKLQNSQASFYDGLIKYNHEFSEKDNVEAMVYYSHDDFSITSDSVYAYSNRLAAIKWNHRFNDKNRGTLSVTNSEYKFNIEYDSDNTDAFDFGYNINETQLQLKMRYQYSDKHKFNYGIAGKLYQIRPGYLDPKSPESLLLPIDIQKEKAFESGIFVSDDFEPTERLLISLGLRYSLYAALGESIQRTYQPDAPLNDGTVTGEKEYGNNEVIKSYGGFEPRVSARFMLADDFSIKGGFDQTYQYIHLLSSNTTQSPTDTWKLSDLNVEPQVSRQFSVGLFKNFNNDVYEVSVEGYYKRSKNILDYKVGAQLLLNEHVETELLQGEGKSYGLEFLVKKSMGRLNGWLGYTYSRTFIKLDSKFADERVNNGEYFPANFDKPHDFSAVLNYKFTKRYSASANFTYQTGRPITYPIGSYVYNGIEYTLYSDRNQFRIPDYFRLDIGVNIEGNHKIKKLAHSFWNISIYNVLGRNNPYSVFFVTEEGRVKAYKTSIFAIPVPTVTYNFKF